MAPLQAIPILGQMEVLLFRCPTYGLLVSAMSGQGPQARSDFNNGPGDNSSCGHILGPRHLFESDLNNGPSPGHSDLGQM